MNKSNVAEVNEKTSVKEPGRLPDDTIRLHLKLETEWADEDEKRILREYGRSSTGNTVERDILVPSDITLHSLHFAIQRLYGWQNSHLHSYILPDDIYQKLTNNTVRGWGSLIGVLFQTIYPADVWHIRCGDDDYTHGSPKAWLRSKYTGPYCYLNEFELYDKAVGEFQDFVGQLTNMAVYEPFDFRSAEICREDRFVKYASVLDLTIEELNASIIIEDGTEDLLERLTVSSVLAPIGSRIVGVDKLNQKMIKRFYRDFGEVEEPEVKPVTNRLFYKYDYGDGWVVEITRLGNCDDLIEKGYITGEELSATKNTVVGKYKPVCIHHDGMRLLDDVGGFGGFIDLLRTLNESEDPVEKEEMQEWAYSMGWSKRKVSNKEML